jgi:hypothetical protein
MLVDKAMGEIIRRIRDSYYEKIEVIIKIKGSY